MLHIDMHKVMVDFHFGIPREAKETPSEELKTDRDGPHHKPLLFLGFVFIVVKGSKEIDMDYATLHIMAMGSVLVVIGLVINWLERRERKQQKDLPKESP